MSTLFFSYLLALSFVFLLSITENDAGDCCCPLCFCFVLFFNCICFDRVLIENMESIHMCYSHIVDKITGPTLQQNEERERKQNNKQRVNRESNHEVDWTQF